MEACTHARLSLVTDHCPDDASVLALSLARTVAAGYMTGDVACWDLAYAAAESVMGPREGSVLVAAITSLVRAIRAERRADWAFLPATCCRLTPNEQRFVAALQQARRPGGDGLAGVAAALAEADGAPRVAAALAHAGAMLEQAKPLIRVPAPAPRGSGRSCPVVH